MAKWKEGNSESHTQLEVLNDIPITVTLIAPRIHCHTLVVTVMLSLSLSCCRCHCFAAVTVFLHRSPKRLGHQYYWRYHQTDDVLHAGRENL